MILIHFCRRCSTSAFLRGCSMEKLWNSFVSLSFCLLSIPNLQYLGQSSDAWMKCRRSLQNKISVSGPGLLSHCLLLCGKLMDLSRAIQNQNRSWWELAIVYAINHITSGWLNWWWFLSLRWKLHRVESLASASVKRCNFEKHKWGSLFRLSWILNLPF